LLDLVLQVTQAKDKVVRYRATQIISHVVNTLDSIDDELFHVVRLALLKRLRDKESNVRVQAVLGLGRLAEEGDDENEDNDSDDEDAGGVLSKLLQVLQHDPSAEVRRALLLNLPMTPSTLPYILERARDLDGSTRRALYSRLLPALGDFRHLSLTHREKLLRWGLRDRDENVRKATAKLFRERWIEDCAASHRPEVEGEEEQQQPTNTASAPNIDALLELLERIDVVNSGVETGIGHEAMKQFWEGRPDYREYISFEDPYFDNLTAESVFVARTFNQFCRESGDSKLESMREDKMPEVTKFAFLLQRHILRLIEGVEKVAINPDDGEAEEDTLQQEFCVEQLLHIALTLDYSDEMGRRKMFSVLREALALAALPEECTKLVTEVLRLVCGEGAAGETEFCSIVLEAIAEVHDTITGDDPSQTNGDADDSFHSARSDMTAAPTKSKSGSGEEFDEEKAFRELMVNMKCVHIAQCMLQNVQCDLEKNSHLVTMLNNLIIPAVRSLEVPLRERGLVCLGLCCLLSKVRLRLINIELSRLIRL
jgi:condensin complex subunit 3